MAAVAQRFLVGLAKMAKERNDYVGPRELMAFAAQVAIGPAGTQAGADPSPGPGTRTSHVMAWSVVAESIVPPSPSTSFPSCKIVKTRASEPSVFSA